MLDKLYIWINQSKIADYRIDIIPIRDNPFVSGFQNKIDFHNRFIILLELEKPIVYGFSDGGIAALMLAYTHPDSIRAIAASGANSNPKALKFLHRLGYMKLSVFTYDKKARMIATEPHITKADLERIKVPALITAGEHDMIKEEDTKFIASSIPISRLMILPGESHSSYIDDSDRIAEILIDNFTGENSLI